jgi:hypothetical protein
MTEDWKLPELRPCEELVTDPNELYLRQVRPKHWDGKEVSFQAFDPSSNDDGMVSGARSTKQTAQGAYEERLALRQGSTAGTWGVSAAEVSREKSRIVDDSLCPPPPGGPWPKGHSYLDQRMPDKPHRRKLRINLARAATNRKRLYPPPEAP